MRHFILKSCICIVWMTSSFSILASTGTCKQVRKSPRLKKNVQTQERISLHIGQAIYVRDHANDKYLNIGLSLEHAIPVHQSNTINSFLLVGGEINHYASNKRKDLHDGTLKLGPKFKTQFLDIDLQALGAVLANAKGQTSIDSGFQVKVGTDQIRYSMHLFLARTQSIAKYGVSFGLPL